MRSTPVILIHFHILISACVAEGRVEHQKLNQTATLSMAVWFHFWCSTRLLVSEKKVYHLTVGIYIY